MTESPEARTSPDWLTWGLAVALAAVTLAVFMPAGGHGFLTYDDDLYVTDAPRVQQGLSPANAAWAFTTLRGSNWHPLTWLSHMLDVTLFGLNPAGHHLTNVLLHALNAGLLLAALARLTGAPWRSLAVAAVFALHPLRVEAVAWVAQRKEVLSALFFMLALLAYADYARRGGLGRYLLVLGAYVLGLLAKPMVVTLPVLLLLLDYWPLGRLARSSRNRALLEKAPLFAVAGLFAGVVIAAQGRGGAVAGLDVLSPAMRLANAAVSYLRYLELTVWPRGLAPIYPFDAATLTPARVGLSVALLVLVTAMAVVGIRRRPWLAVGWFWYLGMLLPVIGLLQVGNQAYADRYTYLPVIGVAIALAWCVPAPKRAVGKGALAAGGFVLAALLAALTFQQLGYWRDSVTLMTRTVNVTGPNPTARNNLGTAYLQRGEFDAAAEQFARAIALHPTFADPHSNLGVVYLMQGEPGQAAEHFARAVECAPGEPLFLTNYAAAQAEMGNRLAALQLVERALALDPNNARALGLRNALTGGAG